MKERAVSVKAVRKTFKDEYTEVTALHDVNLDVYSGEILLLVGPSGSGKTTLISIIAGILNQDQGAALIFGNDINAMKEPEKTIFRGKNIGFVFQAFNLIPMLSCIENISIPLIINGMDRKTAVEKAADILVEFKLEDKIYSYPSQLSGGQQQRVAIARSFIHDPKVIVCDEPTSSLDSETGKSVMQILKEKVLDSQRAIIVVTHDTRIFKYADRIAKIEDGKIISVESSDQWSQ